MPLVWRARRGTPEHLHNITITDQGHCSPEGSSAYSSSIGIVSLNQNSEFSCQPYVKHRRCVEKKVLRKC